MVTICFSSKSFNILLTTSLEDPISLASSWWVILIGLPFSSYNLLNLSAIRTSICLKAISSTTEIISLNRSETRLKINFCQTSYFFIHVENKTEGMLKTSTSVSATEIAGNVELLTIHDAVRIHESPSNNLYNVISRPVSPIFYTLTTPEITKER